MVHLKRFLILLFFLPWLSQAQGLYQFKMDYIAFYSGQGMPYLISGLAICGTLANTNLDNAIQNEWQKHIRSNFTDNLSNRLQDYGKLTQWKIAIPIYVFSACLNNGPVQLWAQQSLRALALGAPQQGLFTSLLGSGRPFQQSPHWHWFRHHRAVSGHAFYGAIPLLNLAEQHPDPLVKITAYTLSVLPGLARVNLNKHYFSQALMGWWLAFSATRFVWHHNLVRKPQCTYFFLPYSNAIYLGFTAKL